MFNWSNRETGPAGRLSWPKKPGRESTPKAQVATSKARCTVTKKGAAKSGRGGKGGKVKSRKQAIAIGLSKARKKGKKVPKKRSGSKK